MLWTIVIILFLMWALGMGTAYTMGGFLHVLLVLAVVMVIVNLTRGRSGRLT